MPTPRPRPHLSLFILVACLLVSGLAAGYAGNITVPPPATNDGAPGYITSQVYGAGSAADALPADDGGGCGQCHTGTTGGSPSVIAIDGTTLSTGTPTSFSVSQGSKTTFTLTWTPGAGKTGGGFLLMHNDNSAGNDHGTLGKVSGDGTVHTCTGAMSGSGSTTCWGTLNNNTEVMHDVPKAASGGSVTFQFTYLADATTVCQTFEFGVWVNSVNLDKLCYNATDIPAFRRFRITTDCDDSNACTTDTCGGGSCGHSNNAIACNDGNSCTTGDHCSGGSCAGTPISCTASDQCHNAGVCVLGACTNPAKPNGSTCTDGNACTQNDACEAGACTSGAPVTCAAPDQCHTAATCNTTTGVCNNPVKGDGTGCDDGNSCTSGEACHSGVCNGGVGMTCPLPDQCHLAGSCSGGVCSNPVKTDGTGCTDGNACTQSDSCQAGACVAGPPVTCPAPDQCHTAGSCNTTTGVCSNPAKGDGTGCNDGKACTTSDTCTAGVCGGPALPCSDGIACTVDTCKEPTGCNFDTSACGCTKDADCDNKNPCDGKETCNTTTLTCRSGTPIDCSASSDACNTGTCSPATGTCSAVPKGNGTVCNDGNACTTNDACQSGACKGTAVVCTASDQCHDAGTCSGGVCSNPAKANGVTCNDQNACTTGDVCAAGVCRGPGTLACNDGNACTADVCNPATGCTAPAGNAGAACGAPSCTGGVAVAAAACSGTSATCPPGATKACAPYACGATACLAVCAKDADCASGNYCAAGGKCTPKGTPGAVCSSSNQCTTSFCVDGTCCNDDCVGQCEACNLPGKAGTCSPVTGKPVLPRTACVGNGTGCDGACDGTVTTACAVPGQSKECRAPSCDAPTAVATLVEHCDGSGVCPAPRTQACTPGVCGKTQCTGCSTNSDCPASNFCRGGVCKPLADEGTKCSIDAECSSGHCVDGVCCNSDCTGQCEACNQPSTAGQCLPIPGGMPPAQGRPGCAGADTACGGACDGKTVRGCTYPGPGVPCRDADCQNGTATLSAFCDGNGSCPPPSQELCPKGTACTGVLCGGATDSCTSDGDCNQNAYCAGGVCVGKKIAGVTCNTSGECNSGICVDGYCCTQACSGQCQACNVPGSEGTCSPVTGAPHGSRQACSSDGTVCGGACDGVASDRCAYSGPTTSCRSGKCANDLADLAAFCQGNGSCAPLQQQSCDLDGCDASGTRCNGTCKADADCAQGQFCSAGECEAVLANGITCGSASHCKTGNCVDGVCCDSACTGDCQACDQVGHIGSCTNVLGAPRSGRPGCPGAGACGGFCDGTSDVTCTLPGADVSCGTAFCSSGALIKAPVCNAAATCVLPAAASCDPYVCSSDGVSCLTNCQLDADCAPGLVCLNGGCTQPLPDAGIVDAGPDARAGGGATGAGGRSGTGGNGGATGGKNGAGGAQGTGARPGTGGGAFTDAGLPAVDGGAVDSGKGSGHKTGKDDGGCGCRVEGSSRETPAGLAAFVAGLLVLAGRRRRGARARRAA
ncbi:MAG TPA: MYXO-CTERM sorting domain-containing protein [Polyangiaceae bacterium]|jgi:hypothetical protein|nr:MYXO-CTERM sorting domain-containing protein [Polyangiaceae bacterium]